MGIADNMLDLVADIPLVRLNRIGRDTGDEILVKPEFLNPSGSIKDRIAKLMIEQAEQQQHLQPDSTIIEATSGNTGTALAFVAAVKGYRMIALSPARVANRSRSAIMLAYGCEMKVIESSATQEAAEDDPRGNAAVHGGRSELQPRQMCLDLERSTPGYWWARQFANADNVRAHREGTAQEILESTNGKLDVFVASVGTGGTLLGVAQALKAHDRSIMIVGVEPDTTPMLQSPEKYPVIPGISDGIIPEVIRSGLVDRAITVSNEEAIRMAHELAEREGIFAGMSSGANVVGCLRIAAQIGPGKRIVTVLPDSRDRYLEVERYTT